MALKDDPRQHRFERPAIPQTLTHEERDTLDHAMLASEMEH